MLHRHAVESALDDVGSLVLRASPRAASNDPIWMPSASALRHDKALVTRWLAYCHCSVTRVHPDQWAQLRPPSVGQDVWARLWHERPTHVNLSRYLAERLGLTMGEPVSRQVAPIALLDAASINGLLRHLCASVLSAELRKSVSGAQVRHWRSYLGSEAFRYGMESTALAPLTLSPERLDRLPRADAHPPEVVGAEVLRLAMRDWPLADRLRVGLALPGRAAWEPELETSTEAWDSKVAARVVRAVLLTLEHAWCSSFDTRQA